MFICQDRKHQTAPSALVFVMVVWSDQPDHLPERKRPGGRFPRQYEFGSYSSTTRYAMRLSSALPEC